MPDYKPILGTITRPGPTTPNDKRTCHRCGIDYWYQNKRNHPTHCRDCRGYLKETR